MSDNQNDSNSKSVKSKVLIIALAIAFGFGIYSIFKNLTSCNSASTKIEVLTQPTMSPTISSMRFSPTVKAQVKNKTNSTFGNVQYKFLNY